MKGTATASKGKSTRAAILDDALSLASQVGLAGLSIGELAKRTAMSKSGLFAHFSSKDNLQVEVLRTAADRFVEMVVAPAIRKPRGEPRVQALFDNWLRWSRADFSPGGCIFVAASTELDDRPGPARDYLESAQNAVMGTIAKAAGIAVEERHFRADLDLQQFAYEMYSIFLAYHHFARLLRSPHALRNSRRAFASLLERSRVS
jgi:AcrR family transcriptional regulator